jgi:hypothetical protein
VLTPKNANASVGVNGVDLDHLNLAKTDSPHKESETSRKSSLASSRNTEKYIHMTSSIKLANRCFIGSIAIHTN